MVHMINLMILKQYVNAYNLNKIIHLQFMDNIFWYSYRLYRIYLYLYNLYIIYVNIFSTSSTLLHSDDWEFIKIFYM